MSKQTYDGINIALLPVFHFLRELALNPDRAEQYEFLRERLHKAATLLEGEYPGLASLIRLGVARELVADLLEGLSDEPLREAACVHEPEPAPTHVPVADYERVNRELERVRSHAQGAFSHLIPHALASLRMAAESAARIEAASVAPFDNLGRADAAERGELNYADSRKDMMRAAGMAEMVEPHIADYLRLRVDDYDDIAAATERERLEPRG